MNVPGLTTLKSVFHKLVSNDDDLVEEEADNEDAHAGFQTVAGIQAREKGTFLGEITAVSGSPAGAPPAFEADFSDGTGSIGLIWMGRTDVPGITPGIPMRVCGRVVTAGGRLVIFNPAYCVRPEGQH
ncbi:MAG: OB-fold nucleic acid binding domain-containing protein [Propionibacteriaceae bacterium]|jgi:hypothetical protein|nr:OB-fold nucleic acid binding domain-containing protein [Propionibacteriaceae bacterium]